MSDQFDPDPLLLPGQSPADPAQAAGFLGNQAAGYLGLPEMVKALRGQMTPEEGQNFFMQQVPNLLGPEAKFGSLAALGLVPRAIIPVKTFVEAATGPVEKALDALYGHSYKNSVKSFDIIKDTGELAGRTWLTQPNPKTLRVEMIQALDPEGHTIPEEAHFLGTKEIRTLIPELKRHFPEAERIIGDRFSGARAKNDAESIRAEMKLK